MNELTSGLANELACKYQTLLGFDFGTRSIGLATGQSITQSASPLAAIAAKGGVPIWQQLDAIIKDWQPAALIVGIPLALDGSELPITQAAKDFSVTLKNRYKLPVYGVDEQLTTRSAKEHLFDSGGYRALTKTNVDSVSAKIILETWFSRKADQIIVF
jgi:putative Holliday junction resolvase